MNKCTQCRERIIKFVSKETWLIWRKEKVCDKKNWKYIRRGGPNFCFLRKFRNAFRHYGTEPSQQVSQQQRLNQASSPPKRRVEIFSPARNPTRIRPSVRRLLRCQLNSPISFNIKFSKTLDHFDKRLTVYCKLMFLNRLRVFSGCYHQNIAFPKWVQLV